MALVEVRSVTKSYVRYAGLRAEERVVVDDVSGSLRYDFVFGNTSSYRFCCCCFDRGKFG